MLKTITTRLLLVALSFSWLPLGALATDEPCLDLEALEGRHPRLLVNESEFAAIQGRQWDSLGQRYREFLTRTGIEMLEEEPVKYELTGHRLLHQSRRVLKRVMTWALLYRMDGKTEFRDRAIAEMEIATAFPDWNPRHFLDVGEMALGIAIGTDWLWDDLTEAQRDQFLTALKEKAIAPSLDESHPHNWWMYYYNNWNPVGHAGLVASALMLAEREPELANDMILRAIRAFPNALESYQPAGAYPEGPIYWDYGTVFCTILLDLFDNAFGTTFGLDDDPAFRASGTYRALIVTPTGTFYNYADCGESDRFAIATAWFASQYGDTAALYEMKRGLSSYLDRSEWIAEDSNGRILPFVALWYPDEATLSPSEESPLPQTWLGPGPNPIALIRENWNDPEALFFGFKGNDGSVSHAHLDAGSFIFEDEGVRWAIDLGSQLYNSLESKGLGIWDRRQHSDRWRVFRLGPFSHNILLIDQRVPDAETKADITKLETIGQNIHGTVDLTPIYEGQAESYQRHFNIHNHSVVQVIDEIRGSRERTTQQGRKSATLRWRMVTRAEVVVKDNQAILSQDGKTLFLQVEEPATFILRAAPLDPAPYYWDAPNPGTTAIDVWTNANDDGDQTISILMSTDPDALQATAKTLKDLL